MNEKQLTVLLKEFKSSLRVEQVAKLFYLLYSWKQLSADIDRDELTFEYFYNQKIDIEKFQKLVQALSKSIKLFKLFAHQNIRVDKIQDNELIKLFSIANEVLAIPKVFDVFYSLLDGYMDFSVANQIADFGVKLLDGECNEIYSPFSNGYNIAYYTDKKILAESFADEFIIELMKSIDGVDINFTQTDPLDNPTYTNKSAQHLLEQFECVLSFPPMGLFANNEFLHTDRFNRFRFHKVKSNREVAHFEHILSQTSGKAVVLMPVGFTYRGNQDEEFRKYLIENNLLETVIQLPPNLHNATSIETTFIIINKRKLDSNIYFLNLKHESFLQREGRKLVLNNINNIVSIYESKQELEDISRLVSPNEIANNNFSLAIDRYMMSSEITKIQNLLEKFELVKLEDIADIRRSQLFKDEGEGKEIYEVSPSDFTKAGYLLECGKIKQIDSQYKKLQTYKLEPYDVLLSTKGTIGKVAIVGKTLETMIASQAIQVIRIHDNNKQQKAIYLYMFLKSTIGQTILSALVSGVAMPQIATVEIKQLKIPHVSEIQEKETIFNFNSEIEMYNKIILLEQNIQKLHSNFLGAK